MTTYLPMIGGASIEAEGWPDRRPSQAFENLPPGWFVANRALGYWFVPLQDYVAAGAWQINGGFAGNWCSALYDWGLNRLATTGNFVQAGIFQKIAFGGNVTLLAGNAYAFVQASDNGGGQVSMLQYGDSGWIRTEGVIQQDGIALPLPATLTPIAATTFVIPHGGVYHA